MIKDSGVRREFESGSVRDIEKGKGRCDLLPLFVVEMILRKEKNTIIEGGILNNIDAYIYEGVCECLYNAIIRFIRLNYKSFEEAILEVSKHFEDGAKKYGERNWEKGIPLHCYIDSGVRHYLKFRAGETDERHDRAFLWNMLCAIWTHEHKPECIDLPFAKEKEEHENFRAD